MSRAVNYYVADSIWLGLYCIVLLGALYLLYIAWHERAGTTASPATGSSAVGPAVESPAAATTPGWEILPEIIALRARRPPYRLLGGIAAASPYFEVTLIIFTAAAVVASVSPETSPITFFLFAHKF